MSEFSLNITAVIVYHFRIYYNTIICFRLKLNLIFHFILKFCQLIEEFVSVKKRGMEKEGLLCHNMASFVNR